MTRDEICRYLRSVVGLDVVVVAGLMQLSDESLAGAIRCFANQRRDGMDRALEVAYGRK